MINADSAEHWGASQHGGSENFLIAPVVCPVPDRRDGAPKLSGRRRVRIQPGSRLAAIYRGIDIEEEYFCNYEVNPSYHHELESAGLRLTAFGESGELRAIELPDRRFFLATLFQPQLSSVEGAPHPVIVAFLNAAAAHQERAANRVAAQMPGLVPPS